MQQPRLHSDVVKEKLTVWLELAILNSLNGNGPEFPFKDVSVESVQRTRACGDEPYVVTVTLDCGKVFSFLPKAGDYIAVEQPSEAMRGRSKAA
jgi:hypothetical protein